MRCKTHQRRDCTDARCRQDRRREQSATSTYDAMSDPTSPLHQTVYGGSYYGAGPDSSSPSDCGSSSSSDSGSSCGGGE
ncbi:hypothetical protein K1W54_04855 [Micromonospora sp. CPCC 205371]|nr:hypothetical protein [Micromonospora sp. CPCC 205371]